MRFAGTCRQYSKNAMPQLINTANAMGVDLKRRWPYQANVMNTFDARSSRMGATRSHMARDPAGRTARLQHARATAATRARDAGAILLFVLVLLAGLVA